MSIFGKKTERRKFSDIDVNKLLQIARSARPSESAPGVSMSEAVQERRRQLAAGEVSPMTLNEAAALGNSHAATTQSGAVTLQLHGGAGGGYVYPNEMPSIGSPIGGPLWDDHRYRGRSNPMEEEMFRMMKHLIKETELMRNEISDIREQLAAVDFYKE